MQSGLEALLRRLKDEQRRLIHAAAMEDTMPSASTMQRVAQLELNIAAIEHTLDDETKG